MLIENCRILLIFLHVTVRVGRVARHFVRCSIRRDAVDDGYCSSTLQVRASFMAQRNGIYTNRTNMLLPYENLFSLLTIFALQQWLACSNVSENATADDGGGEAK